MNYEQKKWRPPVRTSDCLTLLSTKSVLCTAPRGLEDGTERNQGTCGLRKKRTFVSKAAEIGAGGGAGSLF